VEGEGGRVRDEGGGGGGGWGGGRGGGRRSGWGVWQEREEMKEKKTWVGFEKLITIENGEEEEGGWD